MNNFIFIFLGLATVLRFIPFIPNLKHICAYDSPNLTYFIECCIVVGRLENVFNNVVLKYRSFSSADRRDITGIPTNRDIITRCSRRDLTFFSGITFGPVYL